MKKISFIGLMIVILTGCRNESKQAVNNAAETPEKDSPIINIKPAEENNTIPESKKLPVLKNCTEKTIEYGSEQECLFTGSTIEEVYHTTIKEKEVEKAELLLTELPKQNIEKEINKDGLDFINYTVSSGKIEIEFLFAGGVTTLEMEQQGKNVKRTIIHSAD
ncbi:hypothetical protein [Chryseobacterium flavum]|uniref:hypothetical protein n=1 Tax=Chryseobacterium flavum TaxID=415851 RepID=UPI0028A960F3|nr:hypothetical protein [Chryseobacterium flavum]